jgi:hypothetical protein
VRFVAVLFYPELNAGGKQTGEKIIAILRIWISMRNRYHNGASTR